MKAFYKVILLTGFIAGSLDLAGAIISATIMNQKFPNKIFHYIASGVFGKAAFSGGSSMIIWGTLFHYLIAYTFTIFYFLIYPKVGFLASNKIVSGILYGAFVWVIINQIVVPLSNVTRGPFNITQAIVGMVVLILMIGLPIAFNAHKYYTAE